MSTAHDFVPREDDQLIQWLLFQKQLFQRLWLNKHLLKSLHLKSNSSLRNLLLQRLHSLSQRPHLSQKQSRLLKTLFVECKAG